MNYQLLNLFDQSDSLPKSEINCKFVLIENPTNLWLVFGSLAAYRYHAQLIHRFCTIQNVPCSWVKKPDLVEVLDADYKIKGGGIIKLDHKKSTIEMGGSSTAYGKFDKSLTEQFQSNSTCFKGLRILFRT